MVIIQLALGLAAAGIASGIEKSRVENRARETAYYVECPGAKFPLAGFNDLSDAREYAALGTGPEGTSWEKKRTARIFERDGKHIETYTDGSSVSGCRDAVTEYERSGKKHADALAEAYFWIVCDSVPYCVFSPAGRIALSTLKAARINAVESTRGLYKINGQLNTMTARIFERKKHIETFISGLPESEYNEIRAKQGYREDKPGKAVASFSWDSSKMR
ncbi:MAG: hypothetical protein LBH69_02640 [Methanomassiliicoccaceae archaeon]|jgi:hypothetical protein|nr:hypothetical protein [Methanomassiliicoccaceae archaeon]